MIRKFVTFELNGTLYGIPTHAVHAVVPHLQADPLPDMPPHIIGTCSYREQVVPAVDLQILFGGERTEIATRSCSILVDVRRASGTTLVALLVHQVLDMWAVEEEAMDGTPVTGVRSIAPHFSGFARRADATCTIIDPNRLFSESDECFTEAALEAGANGREYGAGESTAIAEVEATRLLTIRIGEIEYAVPTTELERLLQPDEIDEVGSAGGILDGMLTVGHERVGIVDLAARMGISSSTDAAGCVIIVRCNGVPIGFRVDSVQTTMTVKTREIQPCELIEDAANAGKHSLGFVDRGAEPGIEVLSLCSSLSEGEVATIENWRRAEEGLLRQSRCKETERELEEARRNDGPLKKYGGLYLIVRSSAEMWGIRTTEITEILPCSDTQPLPLADPGTFGILRVRDGTYPVISLRERLGLPEFGGKSAVNAAIVFVHDREGQTGLLVDEVVGMERLAAMHLEEVDELSIEVHADLVHALARSDSRVYHLLDIAQLITDTRPSLLEGSKAVLKNVA